MSIIAVLAAADRTPDGRHAIRAAVQLAAASRARLTVLEVVRVGSEGAVPLGRVASNRHSQRRTEELSGYEHWVGPIEPSSATGEPVELAVAYGIPGIEIGRLADDRAADVVVLGRRPRSSDHPLILGETADAVVRRSPRPVLFVPPATTAFRRMLVALDGTERTIKLLRPAHCLAAAWGAQLAAVMVRRAGIADDDPAARVHALIARGSDLAEPLALTVRTGDPIDEILAHVETTRPDILVIGYRRGGPPKIIGPADIARNLLYAAPTAVLTIPL